MNNNEIKQQIINVIKENPDLPIIPATLWEVCAEDWGYWVGEIKECKVDYFFEDYEGSERWYAGLDDIYEQIAYKYEDSEECEKMTDKEFDDFLDEKFIELENNGKIKKAIMLFIST
jgi:hypothetical protein